MNINIEMLDTLLPLLPKEYRRFLIIYAHYQEIMRVIDSCKKCLNDLSAPQNIDSDEIDNLFKDYLNL